MAFRGGVISPQVYERIEQVEREKHEDGNEPPQQQKQQSTSSSSHADATSTGVFITVAVIIGLVALGFGLYAAIKWYNANLYTPPPNQIAPFVPKGWWSWGFDLTASRHYVGFAPSKSSFLPVCNFDTITGTSGVSTTITTDEETGIAYFGDWGNNRVGSAIWAINLADCTVVWKILVSDLSGVYNATYQDIAKATNPTATVRTSLTIALNSTGQKVLLFGDLGTSRSYNSTYCASVGNLCGARYYVLDPVSKQLIFRYSTGIASDTITGSFSVYGDLAFFGISSSQELDIGNPASPNFGVHDFYGRVDFFNFNTGSTLTASVLSNNFAASGTPGAGVWGSGPPIDLETNQIFFGSGNLYNQSQSISTCLQAGFSRLYCAQLDSNNYQLTDDSILFYNIDGNIDAQSINSPSKIISPYGVDAWNAACEPTSTNKTYCPYPMGPDYDFGPGSVVIPQARLLIMMQKSGVMWFINIDSREIELSTYVGPGSTLENNWGIAYDDNNIYVTIANYEKKTWIDTDGNIRCDGAVAAVCWTIDCRGEVSWMKALPCSRASLSCPNALVADPFLTDYLPTSVLTYQDRLHGQPAQYVSAVPCPSSVVSDPRDDPFFAMSFGAVTLTDNILLITSTTGYVYSYEPLTGKLLANSARCPTGIIYGGTSLMRLNGVNYVTWGCGYYPGFFPSSTSDTHVMVAQLV